MEQEVQTYYKQIGIKEKYKTVEKKYYINVDSSQRRLKTEVLTGNRYSLTQDPVKFRRGFSTIAFTQQLHPYNIDDRITTSQFISKTVNLNVYGNYKLETFVPNGNQWTYTTTTQIFSPILEFTDGSSYIKVHHTHYIPIYYFNQPTSYDINGQNEILANYNNNVVDYTYDSFIQNYNPATLVVEIQGFQGYGSTSVTSSYYNNISLNNINTIHKVILTDPFNTDQQMMYRNTFFIQVNAPFQSVATTNTNIINYPIQLTFHYIGGIPISYLNSEYPVDTNHFFGFYSIVDTSQNSYIVDTTIVSTGIVDDNNNFTLNGTGGVGITISTIKEIYREDSHPNQYNYKLNKIYYNIVSAQLHSAEFPNSQQIVNHKNNTFYWQNFDDGNYIYSAKITSGNYTLTDLVTALENAFYNTPRINYAQDSANINFVPPYTNHNYIRVDVNSSTDIITVKSYREYVLFRPFIQVIPDIPSTGSVITNVQYQIKIEHLNHGLQVGDIILISNAISHLGLDATILNNEQKVLSVIDNSHYLIQLQKVNLNTSRNDTRGGVAVAIYTPNIFRIRADYSNSICQLLGFRDVGLPTSISVYSDKVTNNQLYYNESSTDEFGNTKDITNNAIVLSGVNYILLHIKQFNTKDLNTDYNTTFFAKINLDSLPGNVVFNHDQTGEVNFYTPIKYVDELDISIYNPDGTLFDFNGINHSFMLIITTSEKQQEQLNEQQENKKLNTNKQNVTTDQQKAITNEQQYDLITDQTTKISDIN